jgi:hypothetical protein
LENSQRAFAVDVHPRGYSRSFYENITVNRRENKEIINDIS